MYCCSSARPEKDGDKSERQSLTLLSSSCSFSFPLQLRESRRWLLFACSPFLFLLDPHNQASAYITRWEHSCQGPQCRPVARVLSSLPSKLDMLLTSFSLKHHPSADVLPATVSPLSPFLATSSAPPLDVAVAGPGPISHQHILKAYSPLPSLYL